MSDVNLKELVQNIHDCVYKEAQKKSYEDVLNKIDEGVCDLCEHNDMNAKCYKDCLKGRHEMDALIVWLKEQVKKCEVEMNEKQKL